MPRPLPEMTCPDVDAYEQLVALCISEGLQQGIFVLYDSLDNLDD